MLSPSAATAVPTGLCGPGMGEDDGERQRQWIRTLGTPGDGGRADGALVGVFVGASLQAGGGGGGGVRFPGLSRSASASPSSAPPARARNEPRWQLHWQLPLLCHALGPALRRIRSRRALAGHGPKSRLGRHPEQRYPVQWAQLQLLVALAACRCRLRLIPSGLARPSYFQRTCSCSSICLT